MANWHILTGEYPPQAGGVSDYTRLLAQELAQAGDEVHVWTSACLEPTPVDEGVEVHRLPDHFGARALSTLTTALKDFPAPRRILVQYVPQAFGWKGLNIPFCLWLRSRRNDAVWVMFHEVYFPFGWKQSPAHNLLGAGTRLMASLVTSAAERKFVSIPAWMPLLKSGSVKESTAGWLPVPSSIPVIDDAEGVRAMRARYAPDDGGYIIGHFGTYGRSIVEMLESVLPRLLTKRTDCVSLLLGRGGEAVRDDFVREYPDLKKRIHATGALPAEDVSRGLSACDVLIQPFTDGVSSRRTSAMAGLAHGLPIVTTTGALTESIWSESRAVALVPVGNTAAMVEAANTLLDDATERARLCAAAKALYEERFDIRHTIASLRESPSCKAAPRILLAE
jgi:glycosyltransferase involved in cell wall biosynthesis